MRGDFSVDVPLSGRYRVDYRYETSHGLAHDIVTESIDHSYTLALDFPASDSKWSVVSGYVDLFKGQNEVTVKSKHRSLNIDSIKVIHMNLMQRCRPGERIKLNWLQNAIEARNVKRSADGYRQHGVVPEKLSGMMRGRFDFGTRGPWKVHLDVKEPKYGGSKSEVYLSLNHRNATIEATHMADDKYHMVTMTETGAALQYLVKFTSTTKDEDDHLQVMDGIAICQGCDHVSCAIENGPKVWETEGQSVGPTIPQMQQRYRCGRSKSGWCTQPENRLNQDRVIVRHHGEAWGTYDSLGHRPANSRLHPATKHHKCGVDKHYHKCECVCESKEEMAFDPDWVRQNGLEHLSQAEREAMQQESEAAYDPHWLAHTGAGQHHRMFSHARESDIAAP
jgi:hypothetical protein